MFFFSVTYSMAFKSNPKLVRPITAFVLVSLLVPKPLMVMDLISVIASFQNKTCVARLAMFAPNLKL